MTRAPVNLSEQHRYELRNSRIQNMSDMPQQLSKFGVKTRHGLKKIYVICSEKLPFVNLISHIQQHVIFKQANADKHNLACRYNFASGRIRIVAKSANNPSNPFVRPSVLMYQERLPDRFPWNLILGFFMKMFRENPHLIKIWHLTYDLSTFYCCGRNKLAMKHCCAKLNVFI